MASEPRDNPRAGGDAPAETTRWLNAAELEVREDSRGQLVLEVGGRVYEAVQPAKLFALSDPKRYISMRDRDGEEIGVVRDPDRLPETSRAMLTRHLDRRYFIPVIQKVLRIREFWIDQTWTVITDRGPREFTIQGRDSIRFLSDRSLLLMDADDNRYVIRDRGALDPHSRRWVERFVW
ncbi:MAG: DUF1854 domain-containing protein [Phycisphaerae bacterium]|nr:DUF1854 domain-containing protein [Phycisphaerae bacterium]